MDPDDGEDPGSQYVTVSVDLIYEITMSIMQTIFDWHKDNDVISLEYTDCVAAVTASASAAVELLGRKPTKGEMIQ